MELAQLEAFLVAAERGSFRRAAEVLLLSQPSLSARVHALEQELGVPLFHRMGRGVRLTEMGKAFRPYTERAIEALRQGQDVIDNTRDASGGVLQIASARAIGTYTLPSMLERFRQQYPSIKVHIRIGRSSNVLQMVAEEDAPPLLIGKGVDSGSPSGETISNMTRFEFTSFFSKCRPQR